MGPAYLKVRDPEAPAALSNALSECRGPVWAAKAACGKLACRTGETRGKREAQTHGPHLAA